MDKNIRLLWAYDHPTTRFQEVNLFIDAGVEVVISLGNPSTLRFDRDYHDETHELYPDWRSSLTLPASVVERLRRIDLFRNSGHVSKENADLINELIDILIVPADAPVISNIMNWYRGHLLYRVMGAPNLKLLQSNLAAIGEIAARSDGLLWLGPGLKNLIPWSDPHLARDYVTINAWVSPERIHQSWAAESSEPKAATAISYIDKQIFFQEQYATLKAGIRHYPFIVLGKNDKRSNFCRDPDIIGTLPTDELHAKIATSRVFIDAATVPEHLIWPPMEAMAMGVPTLFTRWSGLAAAGFDDGNDESALRDLGMFEDFDAINAFLVQNGQNMSLLTALAQRQRAAFIEGVFSREKALAAFTTYIAHVAIKPTRDRESVTPSTLLALAEQMRRQPKAAPSQGSLARLDGASLIRTRRMVRPKELRGRTGRLVLDGGGQFVRRCEPGIDAQGAVVLENLPDFPAGHYILSAAFNVIEGAGEIGEIFLNTRSETTPLQQKLRLKTNGPGFLERTIPFSIEVGNESASRELIVNWNGESKLELLSLRFRTAD